MPNGENGKVRQCQNTRMQIARMAKMAPNLLFQQKIKLCGVRSFATFVFSQKTNVGPQTFVVSLKTKVATFVFSLKTKVGGPKCYYQAETKSCERPKTAKFHVLFEHLSCEPFSVFWRSSKEQSPRQSQDLTEN